MIMTITAAGIAVKRKVMLTITFGISKDFAVLTTGYQLKAGRALVGMEQADLAERSGVAVTTIRKMEWKGAETLSSGLDTIRRVQSALEAAGVEFLNHGQPGVRLAKLGPTLTVARDQAVSVEQQKANADEARTEAADAVDRVLADTDATKGEKAERRGKLTDEPTVVAAARGKGNPKRGNN